MTNELGVVHDEHPTDSRRDAEQYARISIEDGCRNATVTLTHGGLVVSWWNTREVQLWKADNFSSN